MLLHRDDPILAYLKEQGEPVFVMDVNPTAETIAKLIFDHAVERGLPVVEVTLWETDTSFATYRRPASGEPAARPVGMRVIPGTRST